MRTWPATAATAALVLLAGCSSAAAPATVAVNSPHSATASAGGLPERAQALVWRLVSELSPPPGTRTVHLAKLPPPLTNPPPPLAAGWVRVQRTLEAPAQPGSAWAGLLAHTPLRQIGTITPGAGAGAVLPAPEPASTWPSSASRWSGSPARQSSSPSVPTQPGCPPGHRPSISIRLPSAR